MLVTDFDFDLPDELIAQDPPAERGGSRLLVLDRSTGAVRDAMFAELANILREGDLLVLNNTRVFPARLLGQRVPRDRKSTRLNSSHSQISYAVFCLKKKKKIITILN